MTEVGSKKGPRLGAGAVLMWALWCGNAHTAAAERQHVVGEGQNLARIARRYHITVSALAAANHLGREAMIRPGQVLVVPERGVVYVRQGDTLAAIARRYQVEVAELARQNRLEETSLLQIGQRLVLPGFEAAAKQARAERRWGRARSPGVATVYRVWSREKKRVRLVDRRGRVRRLALDQLARLLRSRATNKRKHPHPRLVRLLAQVSDHFGGRQIHVISGYRRPGGSTKKSSRHVQAHAIDFRIPGVPLDALRAYCAKFRHVGVGYYPNSRFIHLDVRRKDARWTDWSGRGQAPIRQKPGQPEPGEELLEPDAPAAEDDGKPPIDDQPGILADD